MNVSFRIGFEKIGLRQKVYIDSMFYYFIQADNSCDTNQVVEITFMDRSKKQYKLNQEDDTFRSYYCRSIESDSIVHSYKKMPLVSNSMKYPGSMFGAEGRIFRHKERRHGYTMKCINDGVTLLKAIIADN